MEAITEQHETARLAHGRSARRVAVAAAILSCAAIACRTPAAGRAAAPESAPPAAEKESRPASIRLDGAPAVLVMPSGDGYLVLRAGPGQPADGAWHVVYLAGDDAAALARPGAGARLASIARDFLEAFRPLAEVAQAKRLSVTAVFGKPGGEGAIEQSWFARDGRRWRADGAASRGVALVPRIEGPVVRDPDEEASARDAAAEFIWDADRADYDAAWARTSALVKAVMSRAEFERRLAALPRADGGGDGKLYLSFSAPVDGFLPGAFMEAWLARESVDGVAIEALALRLDDDMEWRIAGVLQVSPARAPALVFGARRTQSLDAGGAE